MKTALIFFGGWDGHQPRLCAQFFSEALRQRGFEVELADSLSVLNDGPRLTRFSLIVPMWTMGVLAPEQEKNLIDAVTSGVGLAGFHGGMGDAFRGSIGYQWMVGGQFVAHPDNIKDYTVNITNRRDPITEGIGDFSVRTEQYYMLVDPRNEVLATTTCHSISAPWTNGVGMPCVWKKQHGSGRVFYSALGHACAEFQSAPAQLEITLRGMQWAAR
jgi:type 1 glutamine amidotransferase